MSENALKDVEQNPKKRGLGRGLNALFEDEEVFEAARGESDGGESGGSIPGHKRLSLNVAQIEPNSSQPRQSFDKDALDELAASIREHGILQPILVRAVDDDQERYEIVAGERRWRAAQMAQLHDVPVIIKELNDDEAYQIALIENLQRRDLDPIEEALGYEKMIQSFGHTQDALAKLLGKSRPHIANTLRLLNLPDSLHEHVRSGALSAGHARTLITAENPEALAQEIMAGNLSVRQAEAKAAELAGRPAKSAKGGSSSKSSKDPDTIALENELSGSLGMSVVIDSVDGKSGSVKISFASLEQLDELLHRLSSLPSQKLMN